MNPPRDSSPDNRTQHSGGALQRLGQAFARLMRQRSASSQAPGHSEEPAPSAERASGDSYRPSPLRIVEGMLFVGQANNQPLSAAHLAQAIGAESTTEVHELVEQLNRQYAERNCPYRIAGRDDGYVMTLGEEYRGLQYRVLGRMRQVRLSPAAVEVLALVAYKQPITADRIAAVRNTPSTGVLRQLVRRGLLRVEHDPENPRKPRYWTTPRLLEVLGISSLEDLPRSDDLEFL